MKRKVLWISWGVLYAVCAGLSHVTEKTGSQVWAIPVLAALFFVPGAILLFDALKRDDRKALKILNLISGLSVGLTVVALVANVLSVFGGKLLGVILNEILIFVSVPMMCLGNLFLSLFLWCCIFFASLKKPQK